MCGIAGIFAPVIEEAERSRALNLMLTSMHHRGPDDEGIMNSGALAMGMRRLAIFDPTHGQQPVSSDDGRHQLVFNGSIYNHVELRGELENVGHRFQTRCDTEVLLKAWLEWGPASLVRFRGMFAFALWDAHREELTLVRDPLGIKPLYFSKKGNQLLFASELNALKASGVFDSAIDPQAVDSFLARLGIPAPQTIYRHAVSLRPGEMAIWRNGTLSCHTYWQLPSHRPPSAQRDPVALDEELREQLTACVNYHRLADVPVGAFLSGGLDSAVVVGLMSQSSNLKLDTFSIGFDDPAVSEATAAAETARHFGTRHHAITFTAEEALEELPGFVSHLDQPTGDGFNTYIVSRAARRGGMVAAVSGLGGDELFGGYPSFQQTPRFNTWLPRWRKLPERLRTAVENRLRHGSSRNRKLAGFLKSARSLSDIADRQRQVLTDEVRAELLDNSVAGPPHPAHDELHGLIEQYDAGTAVSAWEIRSYMTDVLLRDSDVFSMRASLELRVPFVDRPLVEWLWQQPSNWRFDPRTPKGTLYRATADLLPEELKNRPKRGFSFPFAQWIRGPLKPIIAETLSLSSIEKTGLLNPRATKAIWDRFIAGSDNAMWSRVWSLFVLVAFLNRSDPS